MSDTPMSNNPVTEAALAITNLSYAYGPRKALNDVSLSVPVGRFAVLLGPNGAGKTTLFSLITQLFAFRQGSISILGKDVARSPLEALALIGVVFQQPTLDLDLSVLQNLRYHAALHGISTKQAQDRIAQAIGRVGLSDESRSMVRKLSGGQRRRVEIARALVHSPRFLLLDEPTVGLDIASRKAILSHVRALCQDNQLGVLWATHLLDEVEGGDQLIVLDKGQVKAAGSVDQVIAASGTQSLDQAFTSLVGQAS
jgi:ABC-2 type transport system ATP-binding protein